MAAKTKCGFCACAITFQTQSTSAVGLEVRRGSQCKCTAVCRQLVRCASGPSDTKVEGTIFFRVQECSPSDRHSVTFQGNPITTCRPLWNYRTAKLSHLQPHKHVKCTRVSVRDTEAKGKVEVQLQSYLVSALDGDEWSASSPSRLKAWQQTPSTHSIGVGNQWV